MYSSYGKTSSGPRAHTAADGHIRCAGSRASGTKGGKERRFSDAGRPCAELELDALDRTSITVSLSPMLSVLSLLTDALRGRYAGMPAWLRRPTEKALAVAERAAIAPLAAPGRCVVPDVVVPISPGADTSVHEQIDCLHATPADRVLHDIERAFGTDVPPRWRPVVDAPERWLRGYAHSLAAAWQILAPLWQHMDGSLHREIERVAVATVRRRHDVLLSELSRHIALRNTSLHLPDHEPTHVTLRGRPLVLAPMIAGSASMITGLDHADCVWIGYPLPALADTATDPSAERAGAAAKNALSLILGQHRATILQLAGRPLNMGEIADRLYYTPGTLTYHCNHLVKAGLVQRVRDGRRILLVRTDRGDTLLDLLGGGGERVSARSQPR